MVSRPRPRARSAKPSSASTALDGFAVAAPGLEPLVARELRSLDLNGRVEEGGVAFRGTLQTIARANLWLRTASRVIVRVAAFRAQAFHELERLGRAVPWERFVGRGTAVRFRVTSHRSRLYHTGAISQRLTEAVSHRLGAEVAHAPSVSEEDGDSDAQLFVVRVEADRFVVSADSSGALLHLRGYRQAVAKAPLRETIAAAMLVERDWSGGTPVLDPMCGSGTIPIEAALIARRIAPGLHRSFRFHEWPELGPSIWQRAVEHAKSVELSVAPHAIRGSDRDRGAIEAARANAARAGVAADIEWSVRAVSVLERIPGVAGLVAVNPPYGVRVGEVDRLRDLYARFGAVMRERFSGWQLSMLSANPRLETQVGLRFEERLRTRNGGIPVRLITADVP